MQNWQKSGLSDFQGVPVLTQRSHIMAGSPSVYTCDTLGLTELLQLVHKVGLFLNQFQ